MGVNPSKARSSRFWEIWNKNGSVEYWFRCPKPTKRKCLATQRVSLERKGILTPAEIDFHLSCVFKLYRASPFSLLDQLHALYLQRVIRENDKNRVVANDFKLRLNQVFVGKRVLTQQDILALCLVVSEFFDVDIKIAGEKYKAVKLEFENDDIMFITTAKDGSRTEKMFDSQDGHIKSIFWENEHGCKTGYEIRGPGGEILRSSVK